MVSSFIKGIRADWDELLLTPLLLAKDLDLMNTLVAVLNEINSVSSGLSGISECCGYAL